MDLMHDVENEPFATIKRQRTSSLPPGFPTAMAASLWYMGKVCHRSFGITLSRTRAIPLAGSQLGWVQLTRKSGLLASLTRRKTLRVLGANRGALRECYRRISLGGALGQKHTSIFLFNCQQDFRIDYTYIKC